MATILWSQGWSLNTSLTILILITFFAAICLGNLRELVLPDVAEGDVLPDGDPARQELPAEDRWHSGHPLLPGQLILQPLRSARWVNLMFFGSEKRKAHKYTLFIQYATQEMPTSKLWTINWWFLNSFVSKQIKFLVTSLEMRFEKSKTTPISNNHVTVCMG